MRLIFFGIIFAFENCVFKHSNATVTNVISFKVLKSLAALAYVYATTNTLLRKLQYAMLFI